MVLRKFALLLLFYSGILLLWINSLRELNLSINIFLYLKEGNESLPVTQFDMDLYSNGRKCQENNIRSLMYLLIKCFICLALYICICCVNNYILFLSHNLPSWQNLSVPCSYHLAFHQSDEYGLLLIHTKWVQPATANPMPCNSYAAPTNLLSCVQSCICPLEPWWWQGPFPKDSCANRQGLHFVLLDCQGWCSNKSWAHHWGVGTVQNSLKVSDHKLLELQHCNLAQQNYEGTNPHFSTIWKS